MRMAAHDRTEGAATAAELRRALRAVTGAPVPFCAYIFFVVRLISPRILVLCVPA